MHPIATFFAIITISCYCMSQQVLLQINGTRTNERLGQSGIVSLGDIDGDGIEDLALGSSAGLTFNDLFVGAYSGATGNLLWTLADPQPPSGFARTVHGGGDVDGDGITDLMVGAVGYDTGGMNYVGADFVVSGATGAVLRMHLGPAPSNPAGRYAGYVIGDADGDGYDDYVRFLFQAGPFSGGYGIVYLHSGFDGHTLHVLTTIAGDMPDWGAPAGDLDQDGYDDVLVGHTVCATCSGAISAYSGQTGQLLYRIFGQPTEALQLTGQRVAGQDLNGDGVPDFVAVVDVFPGNSDGNRGHVRAYSGIDGTLLWEAVGDLIQSHMGRTTTIGDDWNGDGVPDVVAQSEYLVSPTLRLPSQRLLSGADGTVITDIVSPSTLRFYVKPQTRGIDIDGDGIREAVISGTYQTFPPTVPSNAGAVYLMKIADGPGAYSRLHGRACPHSNGHLPRMRMQQDPRLGSTARFGLRGSLAAAPAVLVLGTPTATPVDLAVLGAPGCEQHVDPFWFLPPIVVDPLGMCSIDIGIPNLAALAGWNFEGQWIIGDAAANPAGAVLSTSVWMKLGN